MPVRSPAVRLVSFRVVLLTVAVLLAFGLLPGSALVYVAYEDTTIDPAPLDVPDAERPGVANVRVLDTEGKPLSSAIVRALYVNEGVVYLAARATTKEDGSVRLDRLPIGAHWIIAEALGRSRASTQRFVGADPVSIELRLGPERPLLVDVRDEVGKPIAGAEIEVRGAEPLPRGARTGKDGLARATGIGQGPLKVTVHAPGFDTVTSNVGANDPRVKIVLRRLGALTVSVVDAQGKGVEGATITIAGGMLAVSRTTTSDAAGTARIAGLGMGSYDLRATKGMLVSPIEIGVFVGKGSADATVRLSLGPGRMVRARVVDEDGKPIAKAEVALAEGGLSPFPFQGFTDPHGEVILGPIAPGSAGIAAQAEGYVPRGPLALTSADPMVLVLRRAGTVLGDVRDARGMPIDGATIEIVGVDLDGLPVDAKPSSFGFRAALLARATSTNRTLLPVGELGVVPGPVPPIPHGPIATAKVAAPAFDPWVTRGDGTFRAFPVPPGRLRAIVRHPAYVEGFSVPFGLEPGGEAKVSVVLAAGGRIVGRVKDEKGFAVNGAYIEIAARAGTAARGVRTATDGAFVLAAVPGEVSLALSPPDRPNEVALRVDVDVPEGGTKEIELVLPAPRPSLHVRVLDDRRYPIRGAQVTVASLDPKSPVKVTAFTDDKGDAEVQRVGGLEAQLEIQASGFAPHRVLHKSLPTSLEIELAQGIVVRGVVYAPGGRVAAVNATVSLFGEGGVRRTLTNAQGRFEFKDVPRGDATLDVRAPGTAGAKRAIVVASTGSRPELEIDRIELGAAGVVEGVVVDEKGKAVAGARVAKDRAPTYVPAGASLVGVSITDSTGAFKLTDVAVGDIEVEAYAGDVGRGKVEHVRVDEGRTTSGLRIVLHPVANTSEEGLAPGGVAVTLAEIEGRVAIAAVAPGSEAERVGLLEGDELVSVDGVPATSIAAARARLSGPLGVDVILIVRRKIGDRTVRVPREATKR